MKKIGILASICMFALLMGGCAGNVESAPAEDSSEVVSDISEVQNDMPEPTEQEVELSGQDADIPEQDTELPKQDKDIPEQDIERSGQDAELINMAIHDNEHNIYTGNIGNEEIRMMITRTGDNLSASYVTRDGEEKAFHGNLESSVAGFVLNTEDGEYLNGIITETDNGGISINGEGVISESDVAFTLNQDTFFSAGENPENYYSSLGYTAEDVEQFAKQIKDSINDKTAFVGLIQYPMFIEMDGNQIMIENEESMINTYDRLMEQNGFKQQVENIYTKYMFANYMGICVEDGIMWINTDSSGDYKITAINPPL